jgi:hypothetical protein
LIEQGRVKAAIGRTVYPPTFQNCCGVGHRRPILVGPAARRVGAA